MRTIVQVKYFNPATKTFSDYPPGQPVMQVLLKDAAGRVEISGKRWREVWAYIDTAADHTCIDHWLAGEIGLTSDGITVVRGVHGSEETSVYDVELLLGQQQLLITQASGSRLTDIGHAFPLLLGMNDIQHGRLSLGGKSEISTFEVNGEPSKLRHVSNPHLTTPPGGMGADKIAEAAIRDAKSSLSE